MLLWIRRDFSTRSAVYGSANWLDKDCIGLARMLEKKRFVFSKRVFAHPILWICSGLSTAELFESLFLPATTLCTPISCPSLPAGKQRDHAARIQKLAGPGSGGVLQNMFSIPAVGQCEHARRRFHQNFDYTHPGLHVANPFARRCQSVQPGPAVRCAGVVGSVCVIATSCQTVVQPED